jgi:hypothetical protein
LLERALVSRDRRLSRRAVDELLREIGFPGSGGAAPGYKSQHRLAGENPTSAYTARSRNRPPRVLDRDQSANRWGMSRS